MIQLTQTAKEKSTKKEAMTNLMKIQVNKTIKRKNSDEIEEEKERPGDEDKSILKPNRKLQMNGKMNLIK